MYSYRLIPLLTISAMLMMLVACLSAPKTGEKEERYSTAANEAPPPAVQEPKEDHFVHTSIPIHKYLSVQLFSAPCKGGECPLQIRLKYGKEIVYTATLDQYHPSTRAAHPATWYGWDGKKDGGPATFEIGMEPSAITVSMELVKFRPDKLAVLIRQSGGFEHVKRWYWLYEIQDNINQRPTHMLKKIWEKTEGAGPWISDVIVTPIMKDKVRRNTSGQSLIVFEGFPNAAYGIDQFDMFYVTRLHWPQGANIKILEQPNVRVPALRIGKAYDTLAAAQKALAKFDDTFTTDQGYSCLFGYWVLESERFKGLPEGKAVIAYIATDSEGLEREKARLSVCIPGLEVHRTETSPEDR